MGITISGTTGIDMGNTPVSNLANAGATDAVNKDYAVGKVTSTDNAIVRFDGTTGKLQNSNVTIDDSGNLLVTGSTGVIGYGTGSGGLVTQSTSKSTAVTLNKSTGTITMNNAALAAGASVQFDINNSLVGADDLFIITPDRSTDLGKYRLDHNANTGLINIKLTNIGPSTYSDAVVFNFAIIKGTTV